MTVETLVQAPDRSFPYRPINLHVQVTPTNRDDKKVQFIDSGSEGLLEG
jgi:hypothetical protein